MFNFWSNCWQRKWVQSIILNKMSHFRFLLDSTKRLNLPVLLGSSLHCVDMSYQGFTDALCWRETQIIRCILLLWSCLWLLQQVLLGFLVGNMLHLTEIVQHYASCYNMFNLFCLRIVSLHDASPATLTAAKCMLHMNACTAQAGIVGCPQSPDCTIWEWLHYVAGQAVGRIGYDQGRYVDPLDVPGDWREKSAILQFTAETGTLKNVGVMALSRSANIKINELVSVVYKSLKENTVPPFSVVVVGGIALWGNDRNVCAIQSTNTHGESCLLLKTRHDCFDFRDRFCPLHINPPWFA